MKTISVSDNLHRYIMDHKDADHKSAEAVIYGLISENDELKKREAWDKVKHEYE